MPNRMRLNKVKLHEAARQVGGLLLTLQSYASKDDGEGVWRTINGRAIFIKEGESLEAALTRARFRKGDAAQAKSDRRDKRKSVVSQIDFAHTKLMPRAEALHKAGDDVAAISVLNNASEHYGAAVASLGGKVMLGASERGGESKADAYKRLEGQTRKLLQEVKTRLPKADDATVKLVSQHMANASNAFPKRGNYSAHDEWLVAEYGEAADSYAHEIEYADEGVWRTVNGRAIFIKEGESLDDAMNRAGMKNETKSDTSSSGSVGEARDIVEKAIGQKIPKELEKTIGNRTGVVKRVGASVGNASSIGSQLEATGFKKFPGKNKTQELFKKGKETVSLTTTKRPGLPKSILIEIVKEHDETSHDRVAELAESNVIKGVEIFKTGTHNGDAYTEADLDDMVTAYNDLDFKPAIKIGHSKDAPGAPAYGWVENVRKQGDRLVADFSSMHDSVVEALRNRSYDRVSSEIYYNLKRGGNTFRRALKAVALLGAEVPAVAGLVPLHKMQFAEDGFDSVATCEQNLDVPSPAIAEALVERLAGLVAFSQHSQENDMDIKALFAEVKTLSEKLQALADDDTGADHTTEIRELTAQMTGIQTKIAEFSAAADTARAKDEADRAADKARIAQLEAGQRARDVSDRIAKLSVPALAGSVRALYVYALDNAEAKVKVYSTVDGKEVAADKSLVEVVDGFVADINAQAAKLFKQLGTNTNGDRKDDAENADAGAEVDKRTKEYAAKNKVDYSVAMDAVLQADTDLARSYHEQQSGSRAH